MVFFQLLHADKNYLKLKNVKKIAAGIPAATNSLKHGIKKMGLTKTIKTLTTVNQSGGFDCPGCMARPKALLNLRVL